MAHTLVTTESVKQRSRSDPPSPIGKHWILELYECAVDKLDDPCLLRKALEQAVKLSELTLLDLSSRRFEPQGVTLVGLLSESHLSIHTWPQFSYAAVDIFTCDPSSTPELACDFLVRGLQAGRHSLRIIERGQFVSLSGMVKTPSLKAKKS